MLREDTRLLLLRFLPEASRPLRFGVGWGSASAVLPDVTAPMSWLLQGGEGAVDPGQVRAEALPGAASLHGAVPGPAPAAGHRRRGPAGRHPVAGARLPGGGERDLRRGGRPHSAASGLPEGERGPGAAPDLGRSPRCPAWRRDAGGALFCSVGIFPVEGRGSEGGKQCGQGREDFIVEPLALSPLREDIGEDGCVRIPPGD